MKRATPSAANLPTSVLVEADLMPLFQPHVDVPECGSVVCGRQALWSIVSAVRRSDRWWLAALSMPGADHFQRAASANSSPA